MSVSPNRLLGVIFGAAYVLVGFLGFLVTSGSSFFATPGALLVGFFEVNTAQNIVHVFIGAALLLAALSTLRAAQRMNSIVGAACLVFGLAGLFLIGSPTNVLALNVADNVLHLATAAVLLAVGLGAERPSRPAATPA